MYVDKVMIIYASQLPPSILDTTLHKTVTVRHEAMLCSKTFQLFYSALLKSCSICMTKYPQPMLQFYTQKVSRLIPCWGFQVLPEATWLQRAKPQHPCTSVNLCHYWGEPVTTMSASGCKGGPKAEDALVPIDGCGFLENHTHWAACDKAFSWLDYPSPILWRHNRRTCTSSMLRSVSPTYLYYRHDQPQSDSLPKISSCKEFFSDSLVREKRSHPPALLFFLYHELLHYTCG